MLPPQGQQVTFILHAQEFSAVPVSNAEHATQSVHGGHVHAGVCCGGYEQEL